MIPAHLADKSISQLMLTQETIRCFLIESTDEEYESIIKMEDAKEGQPFCVNGSQYHRTEKVIARAMLVGPDKNYSREWQLDWEKRQELAKEIKYCTQCGQFEFTDAATVSGAKGRSWVRTDTGERADRISAFGPGAMWFATWYNRRMTAEPAENCVEKDAYMHPGFDGFFDNPPLMVRTPGGDWCVDSRANNCTLKDDNTHKCWPRRGEAPLIDVNKDYGPTCHAGSGSIVCGSYHGFLRNGFLVKC